MEKIYIVEIDEHCINLCLVVVVFCQYILSMEDVSRTMCQSWNFIEPVKNLYNSDPMWAVLEKFTLNKYTSAGGGNVQQFVSTLIVPTCNMVLKRVK